MSSSEKFRMKWVLTEIYKIKASQIYRYGSAMLFCFIRNARLRSGTEALKYIKLSARNACEALAFLFYKKRSGIIVQASRLADVSGMVLSLPTNSLIFSYLPSRIQERAYDATGIRRGTYVRIYCDFPSKSR